MTFTTHVPTDDPPDLVGRSPEDYARELEDYLRRGAVLARESLPTGFLEVEPEAVSLSLAESSPGAESDGWASASHVHWVDLLLTDKGDLLTFDGSTYLKMAAGANDTVKVADSTQATGWKDEAWPPPAADPAVFRDTVLADEDDYAAGRVAVAFLDLDADHGISGFDATGIPDGWQMEVWNTSAFILTLTHADVGSAAANRLECQGATDITVKAGFSASLTYDLTAGYWRAREE